MSEKKLSIQSSILWNSMGSIFYLGCQWLFTVLVVLLSDDMQASGMLSVAMSACNLWYCISVYGMRNFQVSDTKRRYKNGTYLYSRLLTCGAALICCVVYSFAISYSMEQKICILLYFFYKCSEAFFDVFAGIYQIEWRLDYAGKSMILRGVLSLGSFSLLLHLTGSICITVGGMAVLCLLAIALYDIPTARRLTNIHLDTATAPVKALLVECFPLVIYTLLCSAVGSIPRLFLERISGAANLGIYAAIASPTLIIQMGATYIFNPFVTLFAERYNAKDKKGFLSAFYKCCLAVLVISIAGIIGGKLLGHWGLTILFPNKPEVAAHVALLIPLIICTILTAFAWLLCGVLTAIHEFRGLVVANLLAVIASAALSPLCEKRWDMQGASLALALATIVEILMLAFYMFKNLRKHFAN